MRWEYRRTAANLTEDEMNALGAAGWELVLAVVAIPKPPPVYDLVWKRLVED